MSPTEVYENWSKSGPSTVAPIASQTFQPAASAGNVSVPVIASESTSNVTNSPDANLLLPKLPVAPPTPPTTSQVQPQQVPPPAPPTTSQVQPGTSAAATSVSQSPSDIAGVTLAGALAGDAAGALAVPPHLSADEEGLLARLNSGGGEGGGASGAAAAKIELPPMERVDAKKRLAKEVFELGVHFPRTQDTVTVPQVGERWIVKDSNFPEFEGDSAKFRCFKVKEVHTDDGTCKAGNSDNSDSDEDGMPRRAMWHKFSA